jgi:hypothetical protein
MACENLSLGRLKPCKDTVGGIKNIYFVDYGDFTGIAYNVTDTDVIDDLAASFTAYKYEVHFSSSFTQNIQSSMENGTTAFEQVLEVTLPKLTKEDHKELKLISFGHPHVIVEDQNGNFFVSGLYNGMSVTGGTIVTGLNMGDLSGYTLSLSGMEKVPANFLDTTIVAAGGTIVSGT